jgi:hypothetical protein
MDQNERGEKGNGWRKCGPNWDGVTQEGGGKIRNGTDLVRDIAGDSKDLNMLCVSRSMTL